MPKPEPDPDPAALQERVNNLKKQNRQLRAKLEEYALKSEALISGLNLDLEAAFKVLDGVAEGDFETKVSEDSPNELMAKLARSINHTVASIARRADQEKHQREIIEQANERLQETQQVILSLSTPVISIWKGVLALPLIGTLDSQRAQQAMEVLLERVIQEKAKVVIVDITGVPLVDTLVANSLVQTMDAVKLIGSWGVLTGISPNVAQTLVRMGVDFSSFETRSNLAEGLISAFKRIGVTISD